MAVASFTIFYITEQRGISPAISHATASNMFSACQAVFTVGRFIGVVYLKCVLQLRGRITFILILFSGFPLQRYVDPAFALFANGVGLVLFSILTATVPGKGKHLLFCTKFVALN